MTQNPIREKYIEEKHPPLMVHGTGPNNTVGVCDVNDSLDIALPPAEAEKVVEHYNKLHQKFVEMAQAFSVADPEAFKRYWYGG